MVELFSSCPDLDSGASLNRVGNKTSSTRAASSNKAERAAIAETLEAKVASMGKLGAVKESKNPKTKKAR